MIASRYTYMSALVQVAMNFSPDLGSSARTRGVESGVAALT